MPRDGAYLLDTNVVLHATREGSPVAHAIDARFRLSASGFRPAVCEVTIAELGAFALSWGDRRRSHLQAVIQRLLVIPIASPRVHDRWSELYSHAKSTGLAIQQDHNDVWIAATASVSGLTLLSMDRSAFLPLRGTNWVDVIVLDAKTGEPCPEPGRS